MGTKSLKDFFSKNMGALVVPTVMILLGLFFIIHPTNAIGLTVKIVGVIFVIVGLIMAGTVLAAYSSITMALSITLIVIGIVGIALANKLVNIVITVLGIIFIINSVIRIYDAYKVKGRSDNFIKYIIIDIATLILGLVFTFMPNNVADTVVMIIGIILLILGIFNVITVVRVYRDGRYIDDGSEVVWEEDPESYE